MQRTISVGTRQSALALTQTDWVMERLQRIGEDRGWQNRFERQKIVTKGDRILDVTLSKVGGKGLFVKEIEQALLNGEIDLAVHSMKDVPAELPPGLCIGAIPVREDPRDVLIARGGEDLDRLPKGAVVGSSSLRRASQIMAYRPDLHVEPIRGNIDTRIHKMESGSVDAVVLAAAGLNRMGWLERGGEFIPPEICVPAVGQGALGIECREDDTELRALLDLFNDAETSRTVRAERAFLQRMNGSCQIPIGALAVLPDADHLELTGMVGSPDGKTMLKLTLRGGDPERLGTQLAEELLAKGADRILADIGGE